MGQRWYAIGLRSPPSSAPDCCCRPCSRTRSQAASTNAWSIPTWVSGIAVVVVLGVIIVGGVRRIASFAEIVVPFMAFGYMLMAIVIMVINADQVPAMFALIIDNAFNPNAAFGAILGLAIQWGVKRGIYANEAGQGTGPHAAAAAEVSHPAKQGYVQAFSIYFDTAIVCTSTAFMILEHRQVQRHQSEDRCRAGGESAARARRDRRTGSGAGGFRLHAGRDRVGVLGVRRQLRRARDPVLRVHDHRRVLLHGRDESRVHRAQQGAGLVDPAAEAD